LPLPFCVGVVIPLSICCALLLAPPPPPPSALSLHDALPISAAPTVASAANAARAAASASIPAAVAAGTATSTTSWFARRTSRNRDRKSTRLNSSHEWISYAVFCLKKKRTTHSPRRHGA